MAVDLWPYSGRSAGKVSDAEHEILWSIFGDGFDVAYQAAGISDALAASVNVSTRAWAVTPGRVVIMGHVLDVTTTQTGTLAAGGSATRIDVIVAYVDHTTTPWTYGIAARQGTPGAGRPALLTNRTGRYEVGIAQMQVTAAGAATMTADLRRSIVAQTLDYGPGAPVANASIGTTVQVVNTLNIPASAWAQRLEVTAQCYLQPSQTADVFDVQLWWNGALLPFGGHWRSVLPGTTMATLTGARVSLAANASGTFTLRVNRQSGVGLAGTSSDVNLNHIDVVATPS